MCGRFSAEEFARWLTLAGALAAAVFTALLWWSTDELVKDSRRTAERQVRSYVFVKPYPRVNGVTATANTAVYIRNGGPTPASDLALRANLAFGQRPPTDFDSARVRGPVDSVLDPSTQIGGGANFEIERPLTAEETSALDKYFGRLYVWGVATYSDVFDQTHHSYFCFFYSGNFPNSPDGGTSAQFQGYCPHPKSD